MSQLLIVLIGGAGAVLCACFAWSTAQDRISARILARARSLGDDSDSARGMWEDEQGGTSGTSLGSRIDGWLHRLLPTDAERDRYRLRLLHAGLVSHSALTAYFAARLLGLVVPFSIFFFAGYSGWITAKQVLVYGGSTAALGWWLPSYWLERRVYRRQLTLRRSLPDFIDLMIVCLQSGMSIPAALQRVTDEIHVAHPLLAGELEVVQRETVLGATVDTALQNFAQRSGIDVVRVLATFIRESRRFGSEIVEALRSHADMIRFQREQAAEENAQKASIKILFPMLLLILPAVFVVLAGPAVIQIQKTFAN